MDIGKFRQWGKMLYKILPMKDGRHETGGICSEDGRNAISILLCGMWCWCGLVQNLETFRFLRLTPRLWLCSSAFHLSLPSPK